MPLGTMSPTKFVFNGKNSKRNLSKFQIKLCNTVKTFHCLYDRDDSRYYSDREKQNAWEDIGKICHQTTELCISVWHELRNSYFQLLKQGDEDEHHLKDHLQFLKPYLEQLLSPTRKRKSNVPVVKLIKMEPISPPEFPPLPKTRKLKQSEEQFTVNNDGSITPIDPNNPTFDANSDGSPMPGTSDSAVAKYRRQFITEFYRSTPQTNESDNAMSDDRQQSEESCASSNDRSSMPRTPDSAVANNRRQIIREFHRKTPLTNESDNAMSDERQQSEESCASSNDKSSMPRTPDNARIGFRRHVLEITNNSSNKGTSVTKRWIQEVTYATTTGYGEMPQAFTNNNNVKSSMNREPDNNSQTEDSSSEQESYPNTESAASPGTPCIDRIVREVLRQVTERLNDKQHQMEERSNECSGDILEVAEAHNYELEVEKEMQQTEQPQHEHWSMKSNTDKMPMLVKTKIEELITNNFQHLCPTKIMIRKEKKKSKKMKKNKHRHDEMEMEEQNEENCLVDPVTCDEINAIQPSYENISENNNQIYDSTVPQYSQQNNQMYSGLVTDCQYINEIQPSQQTFYQQNNAMYSELGTYSQNIQEMRPAPQIYYDHNIQIYPNIETNSQNLAEMNRPTQTYQSIELYPNIETNSQNVQEMNPPPATHHQQNILMNPPPRTNTQQNIQMNPPQQINTEQTTGRNSPPQTEMNAQQQTNSNDNNETHQPTTRSHNQTIREMLICTKYLMTVFGNNKPLLANSIQNLDERERLQLGELASAIQFHLNLFNLANAKNI